MHICIDATAYTIVPRFAQNFTLIIWSQQAVYKHSISYVVRQAKRIQTPNTKSKKFMTKVDALCSILSLHIVCIFVIIKGWFAILFGPSSWPSIASNGSLPRVISLPYSLSSIQFKAHRLRRETNEWPRAFLPNCHGIQSRVGHRSIGSRRRLRQSTCSHPFPSSSIRPPHPWHNSWG